MGIKNLWSLLESAGESMPVDQMKGMRVAIDASMWAHRIVAVQKYSTRDQPAEYVAHLEYFTRNILKLLHYEIKPVFVFDGPAPMLKGKVMKKRRREDDDSSFSSVAMRLLKKSTSKKAGKPEKLFKGMKNQFVEPAKDSSSLAWFIQNRKPKETSIAKKHRVFETGKELPLNTKENLQTNRETERAIQYKGELPNSKNPATFSERQMHRFIEAVSFDTEKRLYAEHEENAFRMMHIPEAVNIGFREQGQEEVAEANSRDIKLKKGMTGLVRGQKDTFFYIGPISDDRSIVAKKATVEAREADNPVMQQERIQCTNSPKEINMPTKEHEGQSLEYLSDGSTWSSEEEDGFHRREYAECPTQIIGNSAREDSCSSAADGADECVGASPNYVRHDSTESLTVLAKDLDAAASTANWNSIKSDEDEWMEIKEESGEKHEDLADGTSIASRNEIIPDEDEWTETKREREEKHVDLAEGICNAREILSKTEMDDFGTIEYEKPPALDKTNKTHQLSGNLALPTCTNTMNQMKNSLDVSMDSTDISKDVSRALTDLMTLCTLFGIPILQSPGEAEAQCSALNQLGLVDAVITDDSDIFLFGASCVIRNFFHSSKAQAVRFDSETIEKKLGFDRIDLLILGFMLGGDYMDGMKGVGLVKCLPLLAVFREHQEINSHPTAEECIRQCIEHSLMNLYQKAKFLIQRDELQKECVKLFKKPSACEEDLMKAVLLTAQQSERSPQEAEIKTTNDGYLDLDVALNALQILTLANSMTRNTNLDALLPEISRQAADSRTEFGISYILDAYLRPNVHRNLNSFTWQVPEWPKLLRYLQDRCGHRFSNIQTNITKLEKKYRELGNLFPTRTATKYQRNDYNSMDVLIGKPGMHLGPKLRKLLLNLQSIRKEAKGERISLSRVASWMYDIVNHRKRSSSDSSCVDVL